MYSNNIKIKNNELFCNRNHAKGFTLLEVIVTLVLAAILGTILVSFMGTNLTESVQSVNRVRNTYDLGKVIENITADYKKMMATDATPLATIKSNVGAPGGSTTVYNAYGSYKVINNDYITFVCTGSNCTATNGGSSILKVTIANPGNTQTITALFTQ